MFKNYFKIALRTLRRRLMYSIINILGLSSGLLCVIFIFNWVSDELSYDKHFPKKDRIHRLVAEVGTGQDKWHQSVTNLAIGPAILSTFPEVESIVRLDKNDALIEKEDKLFSEDYIVFTDPSFFEVFDYHLLLGNKNVALNDPYKIVITESIARKYFDKENPIGQTLKMYLHDPEGRGEDYEVTGVIADPPKTSHFTFNILGSLNTIKAINPDEMDNWGNNSYHTYLLLKDATSPVALESKLPAFTEERIGDMMQQYDVSFRFYLQPVEDIYLHSDILYEFLSNGSLEYVWIFSAVGLFILALAAINYINLSTSFSFDRAKEVGVRKVLGAFSSQLLKQHLMETLLITITAMVFAGLMIELFKPFFYDLTGKTHIDLNKTTLVIQLLILSLPVGLVAGYFPARFLANLQTVTSLKGKVSKSAGQSLRSVLVAFQFMITLVILVGLIVVQQQLKFVQSKDLGYNKDNLMILRVGGNEDVKAGYDAFKDELMSHSSIRSVSRSNSMIVGGLGNSNGEVKNELGESRFVQLYRLGIDQDYIPTHQMELLSGRNFSDDIASDSAGFILNEKAVVELGWSPEEAIGKHMNYIGITGQIIGVVSDFHYNSLHHDIESLGMFLIGSSFSRITIKGTDPIETKNIVETTFRKHFPASLYSYTFQGEAIISTYHTEERFGTIFNIFSVLSMLIAFLGLFGLVGHVVKTKTKEIGIRKVLGASSYQILNLISIKYLRIIYLAAIVGLPLAWWIMSRWLNSFTYRIDMSIWYFVASLLILSVVAVVVILIQALKPSMSNPSNTLKED